MLYHQNNFVGNSSMSNIAKSFDILTLESIIILIYNYFNNAIKLLSNI